MNVSTIAHGENTQASCSTFRKLKARAVRDRRWNTHNMTVGTPQATKVLGISFSLLFKLRSLPNRTDHLSGSTSGYRILSPGGPG